MDKTGSPTRKLKQHKYKPTIIKIRERMEFMGRLDYQVKVVAIFTDKCYREGMRLIQKNLESRWMEAMVELGKMEAKVLQAGIL